MTQFFLTHRYWCKQNTIRGGCPRDTACPRMDFCNFLRKLVQLSPSLMDEGPIPCFYTHDC